MYNGKELQEISTEKLQETIDYIKDLQGKTEKTNLVYSIRTLYLYTLETELRDRNLVLDVDGKKDTILFTSEKKLEDFFETEDEINTAYKEDNPLQVQINILDDYGNIYEKTDKILRDGTYVIEFVFDNKLDSGYTITERVIKDDEIQNTIIVKRISLNQDKGKQVNISQIEGDNTITSSIDLIRNNIFSIEKLKDIASELSYYLLVEKDSDSVIYNLRLHYLEIINKEIENRLKNNSESEVYKNINEKYIYPKLNPKYVKAEFSSDLANELKKKVRVPEEIKEIEIIPDKILKNNYPIEDSKIDKEISIPEKQEDIQIKNNTTNYIKASEGSGKSNIVIQKQNKIIEQKEVKKKKEDNRTKLSILEASGSKLIKSDFKEKYVNYLDFNQNEYDTKLEDFVSSYYDIVHSMEDSERIKILKNRLEEYADLVVNCPMFSTNLNKKDISKLLKMYLTDLYIIEPEESLNFLDQKPSQKIINNMFNNFGIKQSYINDFPEVLKNKTAFKLAELFNNKGSNKVFEIFHDILGEFYKDMNIYDVEVTELEKFDKYKNINIIYSWYCDKSESGINSSFYSGVDYQDMYWKRYKFKNNDVPYITYDNINSQLDSFIDDSTKCKVFYKPMKRKGKIKYIVKLFYPAAADIKMKLSYGDPFVIKKGEETKEVIFKLTDNLVIYTYEHVHAHQLYYVDYKTASNQDYYPNPTYYADVNFTDSSKDDYKNIETFKDPELNPKIRSEVVAGENKIKYTIKFKNSNNEDECLANDIFIKLKLSSIEDLDQNNEIDKGVYDYFNDGFIIKGGDGKSSYTFTLDYSDEAFKNSGLSTERTVASLKYSLIPLYISDPNNIITELDTNDINVSKFYMEKEDFFDTDYQNIQKKNIFPIKTNIIYMQFNSSSAIDSTKMYEDLISMYSMTYLQNHMIDITAGDYTTQINFIDYVNILLYARLRSVTSGYKAKLDTAQDTAADNLKTAEINYNNITLANDSTDEEIKEVTKDLDKAKKEKKKLDEYVYDYEINTDLKEKCEKALEKEYNALEKICVRYNSMVYDLKYLENIQRLMDFYSEMSPTYKQLEEFNIKFNNIRLLDSQLKRINITKLSDFRKMLIGNVPDNWEEFQAKLDEFFPEVTSSIKVTITNNLIKEKIKKYYTSYKKINNDVNIVQFYDSLISMESDEDFDNLDNSLSTYLNQKFIRRYPRLISKLEELNVKEIQEFYLYNFKQSHIFVKKENKYIKSFVNQLFYQYLLGSSFKESVFDPTFNLFKQYFFRSELTMKNEDYIKMRVKDKLNVVRLDSQKEMGITVNGKYSELNTVDDAQITIKYGKYQLDELTPEVSLEITFDETELTKLKDLKVNFKYIDEDENIIEYNSIIDEENKCKINDMYRKHFVNYFDLFEITTSYYNELSKSDKTINLTVNKVNRTDKMNKKELINVKIENIKTYSRIDENGDEYNLIEVVDDIDEYKVVKYKV